MNTRTVAERFWDGVKQELFGAPVALRSLLLSKPWALAPPYFPRSISEDSQPQWQTLSMPSDLERRPAGSVMRWSKGPYGYESKSVVLPALAGLIEPAPAVAVTCDLRDVEGLSDSRSDLVSYKDLDAMALATCQELIAERTPANVFRLLHSALNASSHPRLTRLDWDGRLFYRLSDGSHRFAAARYLAGQLGMEVPIELPLHEWQINEAAVTALESEFQAFCVRGDHGFLAGLHEALTAIGAPYMHTVVSLNRGVAAQVDFHALLLPRDNRRAVTAANVLSSANVFSIPDLLRSAKQSASHLAKQVSPLDEPSFSPR
ncbi:DUF6685 family protein [Xanthomonas euvesicatoria]